LTKNQHLRAIQPFAQHRFPVIIHTVDLENGFCQINANGRRLHGGRSFSSRRETLLISHIPVALKEGVHSIRTAE
jgi:hypothetical protein